MTFNVPAHDPYRSHCLRLFHNHRLQLLFILTSLGFTNARPLHTLHTRQPSLETRDEKSSGGFKSVYVWVPIVILGVAVGSFIIARVIRARQNRSATRPNGDPNTRQVTAEQLAGNNTVTTNSTTTTAANAPRTRRPRRGRRPSQMSVTSLPEYMKEPGDQELVIIRGRETPEDESTMIMPDGTLLNHARNDSAYSDLPDTPHDAPLLQNDEGDPFRTPSRHAASRVSMDTLPSAEESDSLHRAQDNNITVPDPRGEAPPYFEVVDLSQTPSPRPARQSTQAAQTVDASSETADITTSTAPDSPTPARRSGIRSLFPSRLSFAAPFSGTPASPPGASAPELPASGPSQPSRMSHARDGSRGGVSTHRPSHSGSGSLLSLTPFRTLSRQKSITSLSNHLNSPSMISLNSISSPLTHTLTRTEFTYPKSGPTPEQLKLISSREAFGKFGVPYGEDAIAYASASRQDLAPPPGFEEVSGSNEASTSMTNETANTSVTTNESAADTSASNDSVVSSVPEISQASVTHETQQQGSEPVTITTHPSEPTSQPDDTSSGDETSSIEVSPSTVEATLPAQASDSPSSIQSISNSEPQGLNQSSASPISIPSQSAEQRLGSSHPPTSFRDLAVSSRPESRASMTSFETAAETMGAGGSSDDESYSGDEAQNRGSVELEAPSTPKMRPTHTLEATDATLVPLTISASS